ncbi:hypothetical protein PMIN06_002472 [Paraphaeosphaeria minitans]|uniref:PhoD-like phosphatase n=1 Tax=Paraphaeosphaeria minitans TaxID=565426 RepID=A0A9P6G517_9PLEO|nr:PhoD-like phosphatase [Paraphaeosphaeria minitans]
MESPPVNLCPVRPSYELGKGPRATSPSDEMFTLHGPHFPQTSHRTADATNRLPHTIFDLIMLDTRNHDSSLTMLSWNDGSGAALIDDAGRTFKRSHQVRRKRGYVEDRR